MGSDGRAEDVQWGTMFCVKGGLEGFGQDIDGVVGGGYSPDSHGSFNIVLFEAVMTDINRSGMVVHVGLGSKMFRGLVIGIEVVDW